ncbi:MAG TPA: GNAT family N-acetyltransferase [bacterium]|nr:GNAT family N-acetyltransferase [bacterium]HPP86730.1 GNAT family N-acetyltransferase [bacterium]
MVEYKVVLTHNVNLTELYEFYRALNWWADSEPFNLDILQAIVQNSFCFAAAFDNNNKLIGIGRCLSDGASDAYIQDVGVLEKYRGKGIGKKIIELLINHLRSKNINWISLIAEPNAAEFYYQFGFEIMKDYTPLKLNITKIK